MSALAETGATARPQRARARCEPAPVPAGRAPAGQASARQASAGPRSTGPAPAPAGPPSRVSRARWQALGTSAELLVLGDEQQLARARAAVERWLAQVDEACSRFREDSELSRLNAADGRATPVSPTLIEATQLALRAARVTDGAVDPTLGEALEQAGYDRDWELIAARGAFDAEPHFGAKAPFVARPPFGAKAPFVEKAPLSTKAPPSANTPSDAKPPLRAKAPLSKAPLSANVPSTTFMSRLQLRARRRPRWGLVRVDPGGDTIALPRGVKLDLGATAKAWAADRAAHAAHAACGCGALVSLGGDVATSGECPDGGWRVHVTDDHRDGPDAPGQTVAIRGGGLATSSTAVRRWRHRGRPMHHIIDPATGAPAATPWRTVSVAAADCADANIAATAAIVSGEAAVRWLAQAGLPARLVANDGEVTTVGSWPEAAGPSTELAASRREPVGRRSEPVALTSEPAASPETRR